jgi:hypothetical protein
VGSVVEWRGGERRQHTASVRRTEAEEAMRWGNQRIFPEGVVAHKREGGGGGSRLGLNPNAAPLIPRA